MCHDLQEQNKKEPGFLSKITRGDETWVYGYEPETKHQSSHSI